MRWWNFAVLDATGEVGLGRVQATIVDDWAEIAYLFGAQYWGRGFALEATGWLHRQLAADGAARTWWATVAPANERSVRLLGRLGYTPVVDGWPKLGSYDPGDLVFRRDCLA